MQPAARGKRAAGLDRAKVPPLRGGVRDGLRHGLLVLRGLRS